MLDEACLLANAIGLEVVHSEVIALAKLRAGSYFGKGMTERLGDLAEDFTHEIDAPVVIINTSLSPVQQRNLETQIKAKVIDRTQLILEIFGARAQTHAGRLQVELAALSFQRSRLVRSWTHLERQRGGGGFLGGPGERQIELDRRMLMDRVTRIKAQHGMQPDLLQGGVGSSQSSRFSGKRAARMSDSYAAMRQPVTRFFCAPCRRATSSRAVHASIDAPA